MCGPLSRRHEQTAPILLQSAPKGIQSAPLYTFPRCMTPVKWHLLCFPHILPRSPALRGSSLCIFQDFKLFPHPAAFQRASILASDASHSGSLPKPPASNDSLLSFEFFGHRAFVPYSSVQTRCTVMLLPFSRNTASASSAQEQKPSFVAWNRLKREEHLLV